MPAQSRELALLPRALPLESREGDLPNSPFKTPNASVAMSTEERKSYQKAYKKEYAKSHHQIMLTVTNQQYRDFARQAKAEDTKVSTLVKNMAIAYLHKEAILPVAVEKELAELRFLIRNIANNVNQMAHYSNALHHMVEENELLGELRKLEQYINDYTKEKFRRE